MIGTSTFESESEAPYICEIVDITFGSSDGFVERIGFNMFFSSEIEEHPGDLYMFHTVDLERPPEDKFIPFDDITLSVLKQWARVSGDLDNVVVEHRNRIRQMIESTNISSNGDS